MEAFLQIVMCFCEKGEIPIILAEKKLPWFSGYGKLK